MRSNSFRITALGLFFLIGSGLAWGSDGPGQGLFLAGKDGTARVPAPILGATVEVRMTGIIARTRVTQIFTNPAKDWVEGIYIFPLARDAAVDTLRMKVGDRVIQGVLQEKDEARRTYEAAKGQGVKAGLIEQQRPDVFTTTVANIGPGETVEVAIELQQVVRWQGDHFSLRFPMVVAPRAGDGQLALLPVRRRGAPPINPFAFHADLDPGFPLASVASPSHAVTVAKGKNFRYAVDLKKGVEPADSDFVLEWAPAVGREPRGVFYSEEVDGERYDLLMVMPPGAPEAAASRLPRETIFVVDTSGSMSGTAMAQAREALLLALDKLQPTDRFNVIRFSSTSSAVFPDSVPASPGAIEKARRFISGLDADGNTQMLPALQIAFRSPAPGGLVSQVIFATDGVLDDQAQVVQFLNTNLGGRRLFPVAIGSIPDAAYLRRLAALGRGACSRIADTGSVAPALAVLFSRLDAPMLQRIEVQWNDPSAEAWPARVPDLYLGQPLVLTARSQGAAGPVSVSGLRDGGTWRDSFPQAGKLKGAGIDKLWARRKIQGLTDSLQVGADAGEVRRAIVELGIRHHLVTDYTSLVAVDEAVTAPAGGQPVTRIVPVNPPRDADAVEVAAPESPLVDERRISAGCTVSLDDLHKIPTYKGPRSLPLGTPVLEDCVNTRQIETGQQSHYAGPRFGGDQIAAAEAKSLCAEIARAGWAGLTLERTLGLAPSLSKDLRQAARAGLLRGFLALVLEGKGCSEPPADVRAEAQQYVSQFLTEWPLY
jgi:Ca-activated chloride channel family protein